MNTIAHICNIEDWVIAKRKGEYFAQSMEVEGFIHCSSPDQVITVANRFYAGQDGLVLLWIDPQKLTAELRFEDADGDVFPHVYGPINLEAIDGVSEFSPDSDGVFRNLPRALG